MPIVKVYRHGMTIGTPPSVNSHQRAKRGLVTGWTDASTRSNTAFLMGVDESRLSGYGVALSLTVRDCPTTAAELHTVRTQFLKRLARMGMVRGHWLIEWQRRGVPHIHAAIWFDDAVLASQISEHWCAVAAPFCAGPKGQHIARITESVGWFKYLSKHAVRGLKHYQRSSENMPDGWKTSGRMWGHVGVWPTIEPMKIVLNHAASAAFRRMVRSWRIADARASGDVNRIVFARRSLRCNQRERSTVIGMRDWLPQGCTLDMLANLHSRGYRVNS